MRLSVDFGLGGGIMISVGGVSTSRASRGRVVVGGRVIG